MRIKANGISVPVQESIQLRFFNPLFNSIGSHSFPLSFPGRLPTVQKAFGYPSHKGKLEQPLVPAEIDLGHLKLLGSWKVDDAGDGVEAYFKCGSGDFNSAVGNKLLTDLAYRGDYYPAELGGTVDNVMVHLTLHKDECYPDIEYVAFPVYMPNALGNDTPDDYAIVNPIEMQDHPSGIPRAVFVSPSNSTVYLFAATVIKYIFNEHGYKIGRNIFEEDSDLCRLVVFNTFNRLSSNFANFRYEHLVPRVTIREFISALSAMLNIGFIVNETSKTVEIISFDSIVASAPEACGMMVHGSTVNKTRSSGFKLSIDYPDSWSDCSYDKIDDLTIDGVIYDVNTVADFDASSLNNNKTYFVKSESAYYRVSADYSTSPTTYEKERLCPDLLNYYTGSREKPVEPGAGTLGLYDYVQEINYEYTLPGHETPSDLTTYRHHIIPRCDLPGNKDLLPYTNYPLIFLFARGGQIENIETMEGAPNEGNYPMGSPDVYDAKGAKIEAANLALKWNGDYGLVERFWKNRMFWEDNIKATIKGSLADRHLSKLLDYSHPVRIDGMNYLVDSFNCEATVSRIRITEAELFRL